MTTIELRYNPFKAETKLTVDGKETYLNCFGTGEGYHLSDWKNNFFPQLIKKLNKGPGSSCAVIFYGLQEDYNEVVPVHAAYCEKNKDLNINFDYGTLPPVTLEEKETLVQKTLSPGESPIETLTSSDFTAKVDSILHNQTPAFKYLEPAEKLFRIVSDYRKLFDGLGLKDQLEKDLAGRKAALDNAIADIEAKRKPEASSDFDELEQKITKSRKQIIEAVYEKNLAELEADLEALSNKVMIDEIHGDYTNSTRNSLLDELLAQKKARGEEFLLDQIDEVLTSIENMTLEILTNPKAAANALKKYLKTNISKQVDDYVLRLNEYVAGFPDKPGLANFELYANIKTLVSELETSLEKIKASNDDKTKGITVSIWGKQYNNHDYTKDKTKQIYLKESDEAAKEIALKIKDFFNTELEKINVTLKEKITDEQKKHKAALRAVDTSDDTVNVFKNEIAAVEKQIAWLAGYTNILDKVLEV
jgi:hypothetical protein